MPAHTDVLAVPRSVRRRAAPTGSGRFTLAGLCTVRTEATAAGAVVQIIGELCFASSPGVRRHLAETLARGPLRLLDLGGLTFIDLSGIDALGDVLEAIDDAHVPEVRLGSCARRLVALLSRPADARDPAAALTDAAALRAVARSGRRSTHRSGAAAS